MTPEERAHIIADRLGWFFKFCVAQAIHKDVTEQASAKIKLLRAALSKYAVTAEYDYPGDTPELCGYICGLCGGLSETEDVPHKPECLLSESAP